MSELQLCRKCSAEIRADARFCPKCGKRQSSPLPPLSAKFIASALILGLGLWVFAWFTSTQLAGDKPTRVFQAPVNHENAHGSGVQLSEPLEALKQKAAEHPEDKTGWWTFAEALISEARANPEDNARFLFALIEALRKIIAIDPEDRQALLALAEIAFERQAFAKASEMYSRFLELEPENLDMRSRYASALTFLGETSAAIEELNRVLTVQPDHFQANAYLAIAYSQDGRIEDALKQGEKAVAIAPHEEAKERIARFLASLKEKTEESKPSSNSPAVDSEVQKIASYVSNNPVAGKRFVEAQYMGNAVLQLQFRNFPMKLMPDFAKEKFLGDLRQFAKTEKLTEVKELEFLDIDAGEVMERLTIASEAK